MTFMKPEVFAEWLHRQRLTVVHTPSSYWVEFGPGVFQAFPYHWTITPSIEEVQTLLSQKRAIGLRYSTPIDASEGMLSYHSVISDKLYGIERLSANSRSKVRRGLKRCRVEQISLDRLAEDGWLLQVDTLTRQGRRDSLNQTGWQRICLAAKGLPGFEAWAAFVDKNVAATILTAQVDGVCYLLYPQSHRRYFGEYVNNALCFEITRYMLSRPDVDEIFYGLHSLDAPSSVDEFKFGMGYDVKAVRQRVEFNPLIRPLINRASQAILKFCHKSLPGNSLLAKAEGMFRFYLQGQLPVSQQSIPGPLQ